MRLTAEMFVSALLRRVTGSGGFGAIIRKGNAQAGAIFITCRARDGEISLLSPAAQAIYDETKPDERRFSLVMQTTDSDEIAARIDRETRFDPDIWLVEIEPGATPLGELIDLAD